MSFMCSKLSPSYRNLNCFSKFAFTFSIFFMVCMSMDLQMSKCWNTWFFNALCHRFQDGKIGILFIFKIIYDLLASPLGILTPCTLANFMATLLAWQIIFVWMCFNSSLEIITCIPFSFEGAMISSSNYVISKTTPLSSGVGYMLVHAFIVFMKSFLVFCTMMTPFCYKLPLWVLSNI
jgi:hypothetical protein